MELSLQSPLHALQGVGETRAAAFARLGLHSVRDLLLFFPRAYENRGDVRAVIHTPSAALQTFAACRESLRTPEIDAPCAAYGVSGSKKLAESASEVLRSHDLCIMANHGFTAGAADLETALSRAVAAEEAAKRILESE